MLPFLLAHNLEGTWIDTMLGKGSPMAYSRKEMTLCSNTDPPAFKFANDSRLPPPQDAGLVGSCGRHSNHQENIYEDPDAEGKEDGKLTQEPPQSH